jgi:hypothetical protein
MENILSTQEVLNSHFQYFQAKTSGMSCVQRRVYREKNGINFATKTGRFLNFSAPPKNTRIANTNDVQSYH